MTHDTDLDAALAEIEATEAAKRNAQHREVPTVVEALTKALNAAYSRVDREWRNATEPVEIKTYSCE